MYILDWNPNSRTVEASLGGAVTRNEADVFLSDLQSLVAPEDVANFEFVLDYAKVSRMDDEVFDALSSAREIAKFAGAAHITFVTRHDEDASGWTNARLQEVLEGSERYVAYGLAA